MSRPEFGEIQKHIKYGILPLLLSSMCLFYGSVKPIARESPVKPMHMVVILISYPIGNSIVLPSTITITTMCRN